MQKVLIVVGPTASGKSALGVELARALNGEIISADSRQVYKGLDIGTGKITKREMRGVAHHMLDVASPKRAYSASDFSSRAKKTITDISKRGKLPIIVGGTGFYIDALVGRISLPDVPPDSTFRKAVARKSSVQLLQMLAKLDPGRARTIARSPSERNNKLRIVRAIEIARSLGRAPKPRSKKAYESLWIGTIHSDARLKKRINTRLKQRIKKGMIKEAIELHTAGVSYKRMRELGLEYRSLARHLAGEITKAQLEKELQSDIWRYARKQIGYWKRNSDIQWFAPASRQILSTARKWLQDQ